MENFVIISQLYISIIGLKSLNPINTETLKHILTNQFAIDTFSACSCIKHI